jgi:hypothetical protein
MPLFGNKLQNICEKMEPHHLAKSFKNTENAQTLGYKNLRVKRPQGVSDPGECRK